MAYKFEEQLKKVIIESCNGIDIDKINKDTDLVRDFNFNSINIIQLVVRLESEFDIEIDDENLLQEKLSSYTNLVEILKNKLGEVDYDN